jgi:hypothetical protein
MSIGNINNKESGLSVRNKLNQLINEVNALAFTIGITTGGTLTNNVINFDTTVQQDAYSVDISGAGPFSNISDYGFTVVTPSATTATTINTNITLSYPSGTTVTYPDPLIIGDDGSIVVPDGVTLIITSGTT